VAIGFYIEYEGITTQLPINPAELVVSRAGNNESAEVLTLGEVTVIKTPRLADISIESYFPARPDTPAVLTKSNFKEPMYYWNLIVKIRDDKKPARLIITDTNINILVSIESFERKYVAMDDDMHYTLVLKEYKEYGVKTVTVPAKGQPATAAAATPVRSNTSGIITVGSTVIINGRLHRDSYGKGPGQTRTNYLGRVSFIKKGRTHPYHVTTPSGGWLGWLVEGAVRLS
jgi:hypothetical protein